MLAASLSGAVINSAFALRLLSVWRSARWEHESEWEGIDTWKVDPVKLVMGMLSVYFTIAAAMSYVGFFGVMRVCFPPCTISSLLSSNALRPHRENLHGFDYIATSL